MHHGIQGPITGPWNIPMERTVHVCWPYEAVCWGVLARAFPFDPLEFSWAANWTRAQGALAGL